MTPVYLTSTYVQDGPGSHKGFEYSRDPEPDPPRAAGLPGGAGGGPLGLAFASGLAATDAILHLLSAGDHVLACDDVYGGTFRLFDKVYRRHGLEFTFVDMTDPANVERGLRQNTRLVWIESPTNPMLKIVDLAAVAGAGAAPAAPSAWSTTPSPRRTSSSRSRWASTWSPTPPPST